MYVLIENGNIVKSSANYKVFFPNVSFPSSVSAVYLASLGVSPVVEGERKDERFYWVTPAQPAVQMVDGVATRVYVNTPKDLDQLKTQWTEQVKDTANKELAPTDWYVIRKAERGTAIPDDVVAARAAIIQNCTDKETAIAAATTVDELKDALFPVVEAEPTPEPEVVQEEVIAPQQEEIVIEASNTEEVTLGTQTAGNVDGNSDVIIYGNAD